MKVVALMTSDIPAEKSSALQKLVELDDFNYPLRAELIAQSPSVNRLEARLLCRDKRGALCESTVASLPQRLPEGCLIIANNSRVLPARLALSLPTGGRCEIFLLEPIKEDLGESTWRAIGKPLRKLRRGVVLQANDVEIDVAADPERDDAVLCRFSLPHEALLSWLEEFGQTPLPPYISRDPHDENIDREDKQRYQTVYAQPVGSVAAPTAGLHMTAGLIDQLKTRGCQWQELTLHVGGGTFLPVKTQDPSMHRMHRERFMIPQATCQAILSAKRERRPILAVGTTTLRSLESAFLLAANDIERLESFSERWLETELFLRPRWYGDRHKPGVVDLLMTNFHQPKSTLFMLLCSLIGIDEAQQTYRWAQERGFRFFSYGDSCLFEL